MWNFRELEKPVEDAYQGTRRNTVPSSSSRMRSDGFDEEREITGGQRMKFLGPWKMIFLRLSPGTRSYMIMNPIYQTDGVTVVIKSCILKSLKQTVVISKTLPMGRNTSPLVKSFAPESPKHKSKKSH